MPPKLKVKTKSKSGSVTTPIDPDSILRRENKSLVEDINKNWYKLSCNLSTVYNAETWRVWGFSSFKEYVEEELNLGYRIAAWRVQMGRAIVKYNVSETQVNRLGGWTKFKEWTSLLSFDITRNRLLQILEEIRNKTFDETKDYIESIKTEIRGGVEVRRVVMSFQLIEEEAEVVKSALKEIKHLIDTDNDSTALSYMAMDYGANHGKLNEKIADLVKKYQTKRKKAKNPHKEHANKGKKHSKKTEGGKTNARKKGHNRK